MPWYGLCLNFRDIASWARAEIRFVSISGLDVPFGRKDALAPKLIKWDADAANSGEQVNES